MGFGRSALVRFEERTIPGDEPISAGARIIVGLPDNSPSSQEQIVLILHTSPTFSLGRLPCLLDEGHRMLSVSLLSRDRSWSGSLPIANARRGQEGLHIAQNNTAWVIRLS
ncbi:hypothetical protein AcV7_001030 [Taiwanofungus camphoratus]|nr:hypothetical protein AcV7_001030 [Antrodia cinnamomea]